MLAARAARGALRRTAAAPKRGAAVRRLGTEAPPQKPVYMFGEKPPAAGQKRKWEDWEYIWYPGMGACTLLLVVGGIYRPDTSIRSWAHDEALVRERLEDEGIEIEMGRNYSQELHGHTWTKSAVGENPERNSA